MRQTGASFTSLTTTMVVGMLVSATTFSSLAICNTTEASAVLQGARNNREVLSLDFPGFRSKLTVSFDGQVFKGTCTFRLPGNVQVSIQGNEVPPRVTATVRSMLMHRAPSSRMSPQEARFGESDESPLGREVLLSDPSQSAYRIKDGRILQVDRVLGRPRLVLTVLETQTTESGRYLPRHVFAVRMDPDTGSVLEAWTYISEFQRVGGEYLPKSRHVIRAFEGRTTALLIEWSSIELLARQGTR